MRRINSYPLCNIHTKCAALSVALATLVFNPTAVSAKTPQDVFLIASKSVLTVLGEPASLGSGVIVGSARVITNCHVIEDAKSIAVRLQGVRFPASLIAADWERDLCLLEADQLPRTAATLGEKTPRVGDRVYTVGNPRGLELSLGEGLISGIREEGPLHRLQTTAPISKGSSGGGLFDEDGMLIGITTFYVKDGQVLNFAMPVHYVQSLLQRARMNPVQVLETRPPRGQRQIDLESDLDLLVAKKDWHGLAAFASRNSELHPRELWPWIVLSVAQQSLGDYDASLVAALRAIRVDPKSKLGWLRAGIAYASSKRFQDAKQAFEQVRELAGPENVPAGPYAVALFSLEQRQAAYEVCRNGSAYRKGEHDETICAKLMARIWGTPR
jgi:hypothetical protein